MRDRRPTAWMRGALGLAAALVLAGCAPDSTTESATQGEDTGEARSQVFSNGDFEVGTPGQSPPSPWGVTVNKVNASVNGGLTLQIPQTKAGLNLQPQGNATARTEIVSAPGGPETLVEPSLGAAASLRLCKFGNQCAVVNKVGSQYNSNTLSQTMTVGPGDVDPSDGKIHIRFVLAPVLQDPGHAIAEQPYVFVQLTNLTKGGLVLYQDFYSPSQTDMPWKTVGALKYTDWQVVDMAPGSGATGIDQGDQVQLEVIASGCAQSGHWGHVYIDGVGTTLPGLFVSASGPSGAVAHTDITYTVTFKNGSGTPQDGVDIQFYTPPNTTFTSLLNLPPGLSCTAPTVGSSGLVSCLYSGTLPPGGSGSFDLTVHIEPGAAGTIVAGNYHIASNTATPLLGSKVTTVIAGCLVDAHCAANQWCHPQSFTCVPDVPNGAPIPNLPGHTPQLAGICYDPAAAAVCLAGVCDPGDHLCGYANGSGPCTSGDQETVCRSGFCSPSGGICIPLQSCGIDADCVSTKWCNTQTFSCEPKLPKGQPIPTVSDHTPLLTGICSDPVGAAVCVAAVCDTNDDRCGYLNGHGPCDQVSGGTVCRSAVCDADGNCGYPDGGGPCTPLNGSAVCRSTSCSVDGTCKPLGSCNVDADCSGGSWCAIASHECLPQVPNGGAMPADPPHTSPTVDGVCAGGAAILVCVSGVCDSADDKCGYANGSGPCTMANGGVVCRSGGCGAAGVCVPATPCSADTECDAALQYCDTGAHVCVPRAPNGEPVPAVFNHQPPLDGTCSAVSATIVCLSGVCDPQDDRCGHANGHGPCDAGNGSVVCRSEHCAGTGPNSGLCVECAADDACEGSQPVCEMTGNTCVQCLPGRTDACAGATPICVTPQNTCAPCAGDLDSGTPHACGDAASPYCFLSGPSQGECGMCITDADCKDHPLGPFCDAGSGACGTSCHSDDHCDPAQWCNAPAGGGGTCVPKLDNGTKLPGSPPGVATCTPEVGARVCASGVCEAKNDVCGYLNGNGPCESGTACQSGACDGEDSKCGLLPGNGTCDDDSVCRTTTCDLSTGVCAPSVPLCTIHADCPDDEFCSEAQSCVAKLPNGEACTGSTQCLSGNCAGDVCSAVETGSGGLCSLRPKTSSDDSPAALLGLILLAGAGLVRRRRRD